jgi:hypothetical protein
MRIDVQVLDAEDRPLRDKSVYISFTLFSLGEWHGFPDDDGHVSWGSDDNYVEGDHEALIRVDDEEFGPYLMSDGDGFTVNLSTSDSDSN